MKLEKLGIKVKELRFGSVDAEADKRLSDYFINTPQVEQALKFNSAHFLGRKGSGKSSIFTQLPRLAKIKYGDAVLVSLMTPDQYAWGALKEYKEQGLLPEQAHCNAWKFAIAVNAAYEVIARTHNFRNNESKDAFSRVNKFVGDNFGKQAPTTLNTVKKLITGLESFNLEAFGFGIGFQKNNPSVPLTPQIIDILLDDIDVICSEIGIMIATDRLDDSWDGSDDAKSLLIGLLKATKEINDKYSDEGGKGIHIVTFLRSDIYQGLEFDDKDKHRAIEEEITWTSELLKDMVDARLPENVKIEEIFEDGDMRGSITPFNYLVKRTFLRPREIIQFLQECQKRSGTNDFQISKDTIRAAEERYSAWKLDDIKLEYRRLFPEFSTLLEALRQTQHRYNSTDDFMKTLETKVPDLCTKFTSRE
ncbi:P-loop ATPase, Sll1717 family, partial [Serratia marcescens]|uniref:P-loop ATPase, Sll1717 family n=1 Tax=Serratia marcescens TaxID=615 RepID=UPI003AFA59D2